VNSFSSGLRQVGIDVGTIDVLGHVARRTEGGIPARGQFTVQLELEATADRATRGAVGGFAAGTADDRSPGGLADVVLLDAEHGHRSIQSVVEPNP
jgi:hypothetical protein